MMLLWLPASLWLAWAAAPAYAGTCRTYADGANSVTEWRDGGTVTGFVVRGPDGRELTYGTPNGGFERYPDEPQPPIYRQNGWR